MTGTSGEEKRGTKSDQADLGEESARRPRSPTTDGGGTADNEHPEDVWLSVEEHLAGLWDVLGVGDAEEHKGEEGKEEEEEREGGAP